MGGVDELKNRKMSRKPSAVVVASVLLCILASADLHGQTSSRQRSVSRPGGDARPRVVFVNDDFRAGTGGWITGFADYSPASGDLDLDAGLRPLPTEVGIAGTGLMITGHNRSDDLFMFLKKGLDSSNGIVPDQHYAVTYAITFASRVGKGCAGVGGSPGESVYLKAGATGREPRVVLDSADDHYRMTVDKGNQSVGGPAASVAGNIVNGTANCASDAPFVSLTRTHVHTSIVTPDESGEIWLLIGTDSGFEGKTTLYYQSIFAILTPVLQER